MDYMNEIDKLVEKIEVTSRLIGSMLGDLDDASLAIKQDYRREIAQARNEMYKLIKEMAA